MLIVRIQTRNVNWTGAASWAARIPAAWSQISPWTLQSAQHSEGLLMRHLVHYMYKAELFSRFSLSLMHWIRLLYMSTKILDLIITLRYIMNTFINVIKVRFRVSGPVSLVYWRTEICICRHGWSVVMEAAEDGAGFSWNLGPPVRAHDHSHLKQEIYWDALYH